MYSRLKAFDAARASSIRDEVVEAMIDAYATVSGRKPSKYFQGDSHMSFNMNFTRPGHPEFQVLGNCACLTVDPDGIFRHSSWEDGFAEFTWRNIDTVDQETALFAGAGVLSRICRIEAGQS